MGSAFGGEHHLGTRRVVEREPETHRDTLALDLQASLAREKVLIREKGDLSQRQVMLTQEFVSAHQQPAIDRQPAVVAKPRREIA